MGTYGAAIVGTGNVAKGHLQAIGSTPGVELTALCTRNRNRGRSWADDQDVDCPIYTDVETLLSDEAVDIVILCTPNHLHAEQTIQAARAQKHILIEKPVALTLADLHAMEAAVREAGVRTLVSFVLHWNPALRMANQLITEGAIGTPFMVETCYWHSTPRAEPDHWMTKTDKAGSVFLMGGCHAVDAARWLAGEDITEVTAYQTRGSKSWYEYAPTAVCLTKFANGAVGRISATMECNMPYTFNFTVMGDKGTIRDNELYADMFSGQTDFATIPTVLPDSPDVDEHPFAPGLQHFIACIEDGRETELSLANAINVHEACLAVDISANEGQPVSLPLS